MQPTKEVKTMSKTRSTRRKKNNPIVALFKGIFKILDAIIVTPISRIIYRINKIIKKNTGFLDGILNRPHSLLILSLAIAILAFLLVDSKAITLVETESEILTGQPVTAIFNEEKYVVEGIPDKVDIIMIGRKSDLYLAKQLGEHKVVLDLSDYKVGQYNVKLKYNRNKNTVGSVTYKLDPSSVTVKISEKVSSVKTLTYDLLNQDKLDGKLNVSGVTLASSEVYVKGSSETLAKVATVKALIDVTTLELTGAGEFKVDSLPLVAYDETGKIIENVEIVPSTASATIEVDSSYVDLAVKVVPVGSFATGYAIASATSSVSTVRVYGDQTIIKNLGSISAEIDVDGLSSDKKFNVTLTKPAGVRYMSETTTTVNLTVGPEATIELEGVTLESRNLPSELAAQTINQEDTTVTVILKGVSSVISNIDPKTVKAYVDLSGYSAGTYNVPLQVEGQDLTVTYSAKLKEIPIKITQR